MNKFKLVKNQGIENQVQVVRIFMPLLVCRIALCIANQQPMLC